MKIFSSKKRVAIIGAVTAVTLVGGGTAFAYCTSSGTGTGTATVGSTLDWTVAQDTSVGTMYPGHGTSLVTFTATNESSGFQRLASDDVVATIDDVGGNITVGSSGSAVTGCLATWFEPTIESPTPVWDTERRQHRGGVDPRESGHDERDNESGRVQRQGSQPDSCHHRSHP